MDRKMGAMRWLLQEIKSSVPEGLGGEDWVWDHVEFPTIEFMEARVALACWVGSWRAPWTSVPFLRTCASGFPRP